MTAAVGKDLFDEPRAKLARAQKHLNELANRETLFNASNPVRAENGYDEDGNSAVVLSALSFPSLEDAAIAGDVISNLRAALDLVISAACRLNGASDLKDTYFPFCGSEAEWPQVTSGKRNRMKSASDSIKKLAKSFKPWKDGNWFLYNLSKLSIVDKHRSLLALTIHQGVDRIGGVQYRRKISDGQLVHVRGSTHIRLTPEAPKAVLIAVDADSEVSLTGACEMNANFAFEGISSDSYVGAVAFLVEVSQIAHQIVEAFSSEHAKGKLC